MWCEVWDENRLWGRLRLGRQVIYKLTLLKKIRDLKVGVEKEIV